MARVITAGVISTRRRRLVAVALLAPLALTIRSWPAHAASPTANNQSLTTHMNHVLAITLTGTTLGNPDFDFTQPSHGTVERNGSNDSKNPNVKYTPTPEFSGADSFTFTLHDDGGTSQPGTITVK